MTFPTPKNSFGINPVKFTLSDESLDFQRLITAAHLGEAKQVKRLVVIDAPVSNPDLFKKNADILEGFFEWLTDREIKFNFTQTMKRPVQSRLKAVKYDFVSLFSGGLDSASYPMMSANRKRHGLLHHTHTSRRMLGVARKVYQKGIPSNHKFLVTELNLASTANVGLLHIRGAVFLTNLLCMAKEYDTEKVVIPENGPFMINYPVSMLVAPTRTTNVAMIEKWTKIFNDLTGSKIVAETPFVKNTKSEVILMGNIPNLVPTTWSCSTSQGISKMCGLCMACFVRILSLYAINQGENLNKFYEINPSLLNEKDLKRDKLDSFRTLLHCLDFWKNIVNPDSANTNIEREDYENLIKKYPVLVNWALDMYLGLSKLLDDQENHNILGKRTLVYLKSIDKQMLDSRQSKLDKIQKGAI